MKKARLILTASMLTIAGFSAVTLSSCSKDDEVCPVGYEGSDCKTLSRTKFIGNWTGTDICGSGQYDIDLSVGTSSVSEVTALVNNAGGFGTNVTITGTVTGTNSLQFTNQNVGGGRTLSGTMTFTTNKMSFAYSVTGTSGTDNCNGSYDKQ